MLSHVKIACKNLVCRRQLEVKNCFLEAASGSRFVRCIDVENAQSLLMDLQDHVLSAPLYYDSTVDDGEVAGDDYSSSGVESVSGRCVEGIVPKTLPSTKLQLLS